jgi:hypothetical protein
LSEISLNTLSLHDSYHLGPGISLLISQQQASIRNGNHATKLGETKLLLAICLRVQLGRSDQVTQFEQPFATSGSIFNDNFCVFNYCMCRHQPSKRYLA